MKILAMEGEVLGVAPEAFAQYLKPEARRVWELHQEGHIRELYFRQDRSVAVLIMECSNAEEASRLLESLPLVQAGLITFDLIPLIPYPGFSRLFAEN
jgi:muconolactone delta-isomerase